MTGSVSELTAVAADSPVLVWAAIIVPTAVAVAQAFPKVTGSWAEGVTAWVDGARRTATARDDADITDLRREVDHLSVRVGHLADALAERDALAMTHAAWDAERMQDAANRGAPVCPPPSLWPTTATTPQRPTGPAPV